MADTLPSFSTTIPFKGEQYIARYDIVEGVPANVAYFHTDGNKLKDNGLSEDDLKELHEKGLEILFADPRVAKQKWEDKKHALSGDTKDPA